jgi:hypothetical protein
MGSAPDSFAQHGPPLPTGLAAVTQESLPRFHVGLRRRESATSRSRTFDGFGRFRNPIGFCQSVHLRELSRAFRKHLDFTPNLPPVVTRGHPTENAQPQKDRQETPQAFDGRRRPGDDYRHARHSLLHSQSLGDGFIGGGFLVESPAGVCGDRGPNGTMPPWLMQMFRSTLRTSSGIGV